jgi:integrase
MKLAEASGHRHTDAGRPRADRSDAHEEGVERRLDASPRSRREDHQDEGRPDTPGALLARRWLALDLDIGTLSVRESRRSGRTASACCVERPLRPSKLLTHVLPPAAEAAGLERVTWHQFRHIHSSRLNDLRVPVKIAQEQLGHMGGVSFRAVRGRATVAHSPDSPARRL